MVVTEAIIGRGKSTVQNLASKRLTHPSAFALPGGASQCAMLNLSEMPLPGYPQLMGLLALLLASAAALQPPPAPGPTPCLIAQLYFDDDEFDEVGRATLDRAMAGRRRQDATVLIHASGVRFPQGWNGSAERSLRRGGMIRDHLIAAGLPAERIRVIGQDEGRERFGNPGDGVVLVLVEYTRSRVGITVTGYAPHSAHCSTVVPRPLP